MGGLYFLEQVDAGGVIEDVEVLVGFEDGGVFGERAGVNLALGLGAGCGAGEGEDADGEYEFRTVAHGEQGFLPGIAGPGPAIGSHCRGRGGFLSGLGVINFANSNLNREFSSRQWIPKVFLTRFKCGPSFDLTGGDAAGNFPRLHFFSGKATALDLEAEGNLIRKADRVRINRKDALYTLIRQAHANGFEFRRWYQSNITPEWTGAEDAVERLAAESHYFALVFSHDFARAFWTKGAQMNFIVPSSTYSRKNGKGEVVTIHRKPFTRRTIKADVWKYHLRQMAASEDPLGYLKRFMPTQEDLVAVTESNGSLSAAC